MADIKVVIGIWLLAQIFIVPFIIIDINVDKKDGFVVDFWALALLIVMFIGLKLIGGVKDGKTD